MNGGPRFFAPSRRALDERRQSSLVDNMAAACRRLGPAGWAELLRQHGLDIGADDLAAELARPLPGIDRSLLGFEDFAFEGTRGIEPGWPSRSLLFHALASPQVLSRGTAQTPVPLDDFPTPAEIEAVEDYVYGARRPSVEDLRARADGAPLAIVVFAAEYRPAIGTVHQRHADMCYSRTGVSRIGTELPKYLPRARGYMPFFEEQPVRMAAGTGNPIRVVPCRYSAYVAALLPARRDGHGPMRFLDPQRPDTEEPEDKAHRDAGLAVPTAALEQGVTGDVSRNFWVPLHKLFDGDECIRGRTIEVRLSASHVNEKLRRAHLFFAGAGHNGGWMEPDISEHPFVITAGIVELSSDRDMGSWVLVPVPHPRLVEPAEYKGTPLTYLVPESTPDNPWRAFSSSLNLVPTEGGARRAPEYLHARHLVGEDGQEQDLNQEPNVAARVRKGGYRARHYIDFTGDGWVDVECSELALDIPRRLPAYSLVASPDFFPSVNQSDLMAWTDQSVPPSLLETIWPESPGRPEALSDQRYAANLRLAGAGFNENDDTMTAIVGHVGSGGGRLTMINRPLNRRQSMLPDGASGVFAPGWDVSSDQRPATDGKSELVTFLNTYGLGSPFPEDAKLCAALSSFWPAVAPDVTRTFAPGRFYATATPLPDEVIGIDSTRSWDGMDPPLVDRANKVVEYLALAYGDYVQSSLDNRFSVDLIGDTTAEEYVARTLTMAMVYEAIGASTTADKVKWSVLSFRRPANDDADLMQALAATGRRLFLRSTYRYELARQREDMPPTPDPVRFQMVRVPFNRHLLLFADPSMVIFRPFDGGDWHTYELRR